MRCHFPDQAVKIVISYLRRTGQTLTFSAEAYSLIKGVPNIRIIEQACRARAISLTANGLIRVCGIDITPDWDMVKIRRRVEDYLRKSASKEEIIRIASCLGVKMR
jgi:hypothetical protein